MPQCGAGADNGRGDVCVKTEYGAGGGDIFADVTSKLFKKLGMSPLLIYYHAIKKFNKDQYSMINNYLLRKNAKNIKEEMQYKHV